MMRSQTNRYLSALALVAILGSICACRPQRPPATPRPVRTAPALQATADPGLIGEEPSPTPQPPTQSPPPQAHEATPALASGSPCDAELDDLFRQGLIGPAQEVLAELAGASVYRIDLAVADDAGSVDGHQLVCYTNQEDKPLDEVVFRLFPNLLGGAARASQIRVDGRDVKPSRELANSVLRVPLAAPLQPGAEIAIEMDFEIDVAREAASSYGLFGSFDGVLSLHEAYPVIPVYDDEGWNVELPPREGDISYYDASFYRVRVSAPSRLVLVASGVPVSRETAGDDQIITFAAGPARGFYLAASEAYAVVSDTLGGTTVNSYAPTGRKKGANLALKVAIASLKSYNARFGVYPYTELDLVSTPMLALGMEYPGIVAITQKVYDLDTTVHGIPASIMMEGTVGHEVAHQWFYNVVGNDQIDEPWLDEALVQYATGLYYADAYGEHGYQGWRQSWYDRWDRVDRAPIPIGLPVSDYAKGAYGAIVYGRGPLFVEALAAEMGQETFDAFLRNYYQSHAWDIGTGESFRALAEQHCQCDLTALFDQWVYPEGGPSADGAAVEAYAVLAEKDDYSDVSMTNLPVDHIGIKQMRHALEAAGWDPAQIHDLEGFNRATLQDGLDWLEDRAAPEDLVFVYVTAHGRYMSDVLRWDRFFADAWEEIRARRRVLVIDACQAANYTRVIADDPSPYVSTAAVDRDEYGWSDLEEEGLPIIGGVFTHYFTAAFADGSADADGDGCVSVQEAALLAEAQHRTYMQDVVFAVPEFLAMYHQTGSHPEDDPAFPNVIVDDTLGEPLYLDLGGH